jgi:hypothetical protein
MPPKAAKKPDSKPATASGKQKTSTKTQAELDAAKEKTQAENARVKSVYTKWTEDQIIGSFSSLNKASFQTKCGDALTLYVLEAMESLRKQEHVNKSKYDPFPESEYNTLQDKLVPAAKSKKSTSDAAEEMPSVKKPIVKRGVKAPVESEPTPPPKPKAAPKAEVKVAEPVADSKEAKKPSKKNAVQIVKSAKTYLAFVVNRFLYELFSVENDKDIENVESSESFQSLALHHVTKDFSAQMSRSVVTTVNRLEAAITFDNTHNFDNILARELNNDLKEYAAKKLVDYVKRYVVKYFQLIAHHVANALWSSRRAVNAKMIEEIMRNLELGNHQYLVETEVIQDEERDYLVTNGLFELMRDFERELNPVVELTEEQKAERAAKKKESAKKKPSTTKTEDTSENGSDEKAEDAEDTEEDTEDAEDGDEAEVEEPAPAKQAPVAAKVTKPVGKPVAAKK